MVEPTLALLTGLIAGGAAFLAGWLLNRASRRLPSAALAEPPEPPVTLMLRDGHAGRGWRAHPVAFHQHEGAYYPVWLLRRFDAHVRH